MTWVRIILVFFQMGGRLSVENEVLCRFIFPERPGSLMKFLDAFSPRWNISLFHYRGQVCIWTLFCSINFSLFNFQWSIVTFLLQPATGWNWCQHISRNPGSREWAGWVSRSCQQAWIWLRSCNWWQQLRAFDALIRACCVILAQLDCTSRHAQLVRERKEERKRKSKGPLESRYP